MLAVLLAGLLFAMAPTTLAESSDVTLDANLVDAPQKGWYSSGEVVAVNAVLSNSGDQVIIEIDPTCSEVLRVWNDDLIIFDGTVNCLDQSNDMNLESQSSITLETLYWDLTDSDGQFVPSGDYTIEYILSGEGLSSMIDVQVQMPFSIPEGLELELIVTSRDGVLTDASPSIVTLRLHNNLNEEIALNFGDCKLVINSQLRDSCGPDKLSSNEILTISQYPVILDAGEYLISATLGDSTLSSETSVIVIQDERQPVNTENLADITLSLVHEGNSTFGESETLDSEISISNQGDTEVTLDFTTSCRAETWVVNSAGEVVMDSRMQKECVELQSQNLISPGDERSYSQPNWAFTGLDGCIVTPGELMVVMEIPEHGLFDTSLIDLSRARSSNCKSQTMQITAEISGESLLIINPEIVSISEDEIIWLGACGLDTKLLGPNGEVGAQLTQCNEKESSTKRFTTLSLDAVEFDMSGLPDGEYSLYFTSISEPFVESSMTFDWAVSVDEETVTNEDSTETEELLPSRTVTGTWSSTNTDDGVCWLLNSAEEGIVTLAGAPGLVSWAPESGASGEYIVHDSDAALQCSNFAANAIIIEEVNIQSVQPIEEDSKESEEKSQEPEIIGVQEEEISPVVVTVGVVVASGGIFSLLIGLIATNESLRIPATSAGLWFLGLIGRTSETSDGRYQRGRLMGYLTANPGCHFRALMAALEMSNGQITHHLKVLEDEGGIWRRPDGRLVRFYPFTSNLHPGIIEDELPLPPLSPDPNSLQGKILRLLDDDGIMKKYPTQAELAHRLDRSQQLVSHHLRTLQKFGLVEKRKMGVRNRYSLTREAVFLLDTTEV